MKLWCSGAEVESIVACDSVWWLAVAVSGDWRWLRDVGCACVVGEGWYWGRVLEASGKVTRKRGKMTCKQVT